MDYLIQLAPQLKEHLRALRKARGLTQADVGQLVGVGQSRMAEIEANPGAISVEQLLTILSALNTSMVVRDAVQALPADHLQATSRTRAVFEPPAPSSYNPPGDSAYEAGPDEAPKKPREGKWKITRRKADSYAAEPSFLVTRTDAASARTANQYGAELLRSANPAFDMSLQAPNQWILRTKRRGSW